jgi:uncharacterized membrane protein
MQGIHFPMMLEVSGAAWIVVLVVLVILAGAAIRNVARLRLFGGRGESGLEPSDERYIHGRVKFEEYEKARHTRPRALRARSRAVDDR